MPLTGKLGTDLAFLRLLGIGKMIMMSSVALAWAIIFSVIGSAFVSAAENDNSTSQGISIVAQDRKFIRLSFPTQTGREYQVSSSSDLIRWRLAGGAIKGTGKPASLTYDATSANIFFRVHSKPEQAPVTLTTEPGEGQSVKVVFNTSAGKKYQVYASNDLKGWVPFGDIILATGPNASLAYDPTKAGVSFFRVEEIDVTPLAQMVWIKPGTFTMGSPLAEQDRDLDEDPLTQVTIARGFWMSKYEVTQREYSELMGANPSSFKGNPSLPVEDVTWKEAVAFCVRLTEEEQAAGRLPAGYEYRLPTEAEFEYAARAGSSTRFSFGDDPEYTLIDHYAWYSGNSGGKTHPVGRKLPNAFGLYDMHGNVWEWCMDWYYPFYPGGSVLNPVGPNNGVVRVFRGGGWDYTAASCRSAFRNNVSPTISARYIGFRVVLAPVFTN